MSNLDPQTLFYLFGLFVVILLIIAVLAGIFSVWMLSDCLRRDLPHKNKWVFLIALFNFMGAAAYYYSVKKKADQLKKAYGINQQSRGARGLKIG